MKKLKSLFYSFSLISFFVSNASAITANDDKSIQKAILFHVNEYRAKHHLKPLQLNNQMSAEAAKHSQDMARHAIPFGHANFFKRISRLYAQIKNCAGGSENVAYNYKDGSTVVRNWLTSSGHRRNIEGNFNLTGIGVARDKQGKLYFTQIFIRTANPKKLA